MYVEKSWPLSDDDDVDTRNLAQLNTPWCVNEGKTLKILTEGWDIVVEKYFFYGHSQMWHIGNDNMKLKKCKTFKIFAREFFHG